MDSDFDLSKRELHSGYMMVIHAKAVGTHGDLWGPMGTHGPWVPIGTQGLANIFFEASNLD